MCPRLRFYQHVMNSHHQLVDVHGKIGRTGDAHRQVPPSGVGTAATMICYELIYITL